MLIRAEQPEDDRHVYEVNRAAFGSVKEAELVNQLRDAGRPLVSLVALEHDRVVGHLLFTPVRVVSDSEFGAMALGPMAVLPELQRRGIGSQLVRTGLDACRAAGHEVVFVLGHPKFYPRFGFVPTRPLGITWERQVPEGVFTVAELFPGALRGRQGIVRYLPEFSAV